MYPKSGEYYSTTSILIIILTEIYLNNSENTDISRKLLCIINSDYFSVTKYVLIWINNPIQYYNHIFILNVKVSLYTTFKTNLYDINLLIFIY